MSLESQEDAQAALLALYELNLHFLRTRPAGTWAPLLESHVRYKREPRNPDGTPRVERWLTIQELYLEGTGDCEDLAAALAAQSTVAGRVAVPRIDAVREGLYHITVHYGDGTRTDPSALLGMGSSSSNPQTRGRQLRDIARRVTRRTAGAAADAALSTTTGRVLSGLARGMTR